MRHRAVKQGKALPAMYAKPFSELQFFPKRLAQLDKWRTPRTVFVGSQCDLFHPDVPIDWQSQVTGNIAARGGKHAILLLTKRADRMREAASRWWGEKASLLLSQVYFGVTCCNQAELDEKLPDLEAIPCRRKWLSLEPLLGPIIIPETALLAGLSQVIIGAESGPGRRPCDVAWINAIAEQCSTAGVRCYIKQAALNGRVVQYAPSPDCLAWPLRKLGPIDNLGGFCMTPCLKPTGDCPRLSKGAKDAEHD
jgi:protein gp37